MIVILHGNNDTGIDTLWRIVTQSFEWQTLSIKLRKDAG